MATGSVKWFDKNKGFGFIIPDEGGDDLFAHYSSIEGAGFKTLEERDRVEFDVEKTDKGYQALNIKIVDDDAEGEDEQD